MWPRGITEFLFEDCTYELGEGGPRMFQRDLLDCPMVLYRFRPEHLISPFEQITRCVYVCEHMRVCTQGKSHTQSFSGTVQLFVETGS